MEEYRKYDLKCIRRQHSKDVGFCVPEAQLKAAIGNEAESVEAIRQLFSNEGICFAAIDYLATEHRNTMCQLALELLYDSTAGAWLADRGGSFRAKVALWMDDDQPQFGWLFSFNTKKLADEFQRQLSTASELSYAEFCNALGGGE